jgi:hypothetical protein
MGNKYRSGQELHTFQIQMTKRSQYAVMPQISNWTNK